MAENPDEDLQAFLDEGEGFDLADLPESATLTQDAPSTERPHEAGSPPAPLEPLPAPPPTGPRREAPMPPREPFADPTAPLAKTPAELLREKQELLQKLQSEVEALKASADEMGEAGFLVTVRRLVGAAEADVRRMCVGIDLAPEPAHANLTRALAWLDRAIETLAEPEETNPAEA